MNIHSRRALYDIQWGHIDRPTHRNTSWDQARFEVPAQKWACLQEPGYTVAVLNDCKYGYDIKDQHLRLTLIKTSTFPDPDADIGTHEFTYSLLATNTNDIHRIDYEAWDINSAPVLIPWDSASKEGLQRAFVSCENSAIEIQTVKPAEEGEGFIVRFYESAGSHTTSTLHFAAPLDSIERCDILEQPLEKLCGSCSQVEIPVRPFEIVSLRCSPSGSSSGG